MRAKKFRNEEKKRTIHFQIDLCRNSYVFAPKLKIKSKKKEIRTTHAA